MEQKVMKGEIDKKFDEALKQFEEMTKRIASMHSLLLHTQIENGDIEALDNLGDNSRFDVPTIEELTAKGVRGPYEVVFIRDPLANIINKYSI